MLDRRTLVGGLAAVGTCGLATLTGCGASSTAPRGRGDAVPVSWARYRVGRPACIDPAGLADRAGCIVALQLFEPLTRLDALSGDPVPAACASFACSPDARVFTFRLREGAVFHNGEPVTSHAFKRGWERLVRGCGGLASDDPAAPMPLASLLSEIEGDEMGHEDLSGVCCPDDLILEVTLAHPFADFAHIVAHPALSPVPEAAMDDPESFAVAPIGNGPFRMKDLWDSEREIRLVAFSDYVHGVPSVKGALFVTENDTRAAYKQFLAGNLDVSDVPVDQYIDAGESTDLAEDGRTMGPGTRLARVTEPSVLYLACGPSGAALGDATFRQALSLAVDREALCDKALRGSFEPAQGPVPPCLGETPAWTWCAYDSERASELLDAKYPADEKGMRGITVVLTHHADGVRKRVAEQVRTDLEAVGIAVRLVESAPDAALPSPGTGKSDDESRDDEVELVLASWAPACPSVTAMVEPLLSVASSVPGPGRYEQPEVAGLLSAARTAPDPAARRDLLVQALTIAGEGIPVIPLAHPVQTKIASDRVTHLVIAPDGAPDLAHMVI